MMAIIRRIGAVCGSLAIICALLYFAIGKVAFEPRLAVGVVSLNQVLQLGMFAGLAALLWCGDATRAVRSRVLWITAALTLLLAIRAIGAVNTAYAPAKPLGYLGVVLPSFALLVSQIRGPADVRRFLVFWALVGTGMMLLGVVLLAAGDSPPRLAVFGGGANVYARMLGAAILIWVGLDPRRGARRGLARGLALSGFTVALLFAGSKTVILSLGIALSLLGWYRHNRRLFFGALAATLFFGVAPRLTNLHVPRAIKDRGEIRMFIPPDVDDPQGSYGTRLTYYSQSLRLLARGSWFGVGTGEWPVALGLPTGRRYPHNLELELGCELGLMGIVWLLMLIALTARWLRQEHHANADPELLGTLLALLCFWFLNAQLSGDLLDNRWVLLVALLVECVASRTPAPRPIESRAHSQSLGVQAPA